MSQASTTWMQYYDAVRRGDRREAERLLRVIHNFGPGQQSNRSAPQGSSSRQVRGGCSRCRKRFQ